MENISETRNKINPTSRFNLINTMIRVCGRCGLAVDQTAGKNRCRHCNELPGRASFRGYESYFKDPKAIWGFETISTILGDNLWDVISIVRDEGVYPRYRNVASSLEGFFRWVKPNVGRATLTRQGIYAYYRSRSLIPWDVMVDALYKFYNPVVERVVTRKRKYAGKVNQRDPRIKRDLSCLYYFMLEYGKLLLNPIGDEEDWKIYDELMEKGIYATDALYIHENRELLFSQVKKVIDFYSEKKFPDVTNKFTKEKKIIYDLPGERPYDDSQSSTQREG